MAWEDVIAGAGKGALSGAAIGTGATPGLGTAIGGGIGALVGGVAGGLGGRKKSTETPIQKQQRQLVDQLIGSLNGKGQYADLFNADEAAFQRSVVDPARAQFRNKTAPQIQQSYIQSGQQRGTGMEDTLTRAGVDMDTLLNEQYMNYQQGAQNRKSNAIGSILGQGAGTDPENQSWASAAGQGAAGYFAGDFKKDFADILKSFQDKEVPDPGLGDTFSDQPKGFERSNQVYDPYSGIQRYEGV